MELKEKRLVQLNEQIERAKDPGTYEALSHMESASQPGVRTFAARRRGRDHVRKGTACQDWCLTADVDGCVILAAADGVGSCMHSDTGSRAACGAVLRAVRSAARKCPDETELVRRLLSGAFRKKLVMEWTCMILETAASGMEDAKEILKEFDEYASTILFAVITDNYYVAGNLGDGQILIFNDDTGFKLRTHGVKESSRVNSLVDANCAAEHFQVAAYPRSVFNGILLSTDGMYDCLSGNTHFLKYAQQLRERFAEQDPPAPYLPFCYLEDGMPLTDFSAARTGDDCTIVLAADSKDTDSVLGEVCGRIREQTDAFIPGRWSGSASSFLVSKSGRVFNVVAGESGEPINDLQLGSIVVDWPLQVWIDEGIRYAAYLPDEGKTPEEMYSDGSLGDNGAGWDDPDLTSELYSGIIQLQRELRDKGLTLNDNAVFLLSFADGTLHVKPEAVSINDVKGSTALPAGIANCFSGFMGTLCAAGKTIPLFDTGYYDRGKAISRCGSDDLPLCKIIKENKVLYLKNISGCEWQVAETGDRIVPGEKVSLAHQFSFTAGEDEDKECYRFIPKEKP